MSADGNRDLIKHLYTSLDAGDGEAMAACYAENARFSDPAFGDLRGSQIGDMWRMLTSRSTDLAVVLGENGADETTGHADWVATYTFTRTGRPVINEIRAKFVFAGGLIVEHDDHFDFLRWARQAFGPAGWAIGLLPPLKMRARNTARAQLEEFSAGRRP